MSNHKDKASKPIDGMKSIYGTENSDHIVGTKHGDVIYALGGWDRVKAGEGNDIIHPGTGTDNLYGEGGADRFVFTYADLQSEIATIGYLQEDYIHDFNNKERDKLELVGFDPANVHVTSMGLNGDFHTYVMLRTESIYHSDIFITLTNSPSFTINDIIFS